MARAGLQTELQLYLKQINEVPLLTAEEFEKEAERKKAPVKTKVRTVALVELLASTSVVVLAHISF